jgi:hypothetical protein
MKTYSSGLIGMDVKPRRKVGRSMKNRYRGTYRRWVFPVFISLVMVGLFVVAGLR